MSSEQLVGIRKCLHRSGSRSQPRQGPKLGRTVQPHGQHVPQGQEPGRKRRWRGVFEAPLGAVTDGTKWVEQSGISAYRRWLRAPCLQESVSDMVGGGSLSIINSDKNTKNVT